MRLMNRLVIRILVIVGAVYLASLALPYIATYLKIAALVFVAAFVWLMTSRR